MKARRRVAVALAATAALVLAGCTDDGEDAAPATPGQKSDLKYAVITHGGAGDAFWDVVKKGAEQAGKDLGVTVDYQGSGQPAEQANMINAAVANKVNGIVVSMANPDALADPIKKAVAAGIPVITINSGAAKSGELGALAHVGQDEAIAGQGAGRELQKAGVKKVLCIKHEAANVGLDQRCTGTAETLGGQVVPLQVSGENIAEAQNTIASKLQQDKSIDGVLALNPAVGAAAVEAVSKAGSSAKVATFDLNADVIEAVLAGKILFAVDQQQYVQGYLPIVMLNLYNNNANTLGGGQPVLTGPGFVTKENAAKVKDLTGKGTR
ncbi:MAG TPA: sugar ABC transporter substrate-binding protein [Micromonosporaceae bacterium]|nr:sugar ABC transporter substrate-binding protein [Micromonosporaceae bacterium]